jgi:hypothetical protein
MTDIFERNLDFHTYMAAIIANIPYEDMVDRVESGDEQAKRIAISPRSSTCRVSTAPDGRSSSTLGAHSTT